MMSLFHNVASKLEGSRPLRVVFLNDTGFIGGAGVAHRRQIQSFLLGGHAVSALCWLNNDSANPLPPRGSGFLGKWLGLKSLPSLHAGNGISRQQITDTVVAYIAEEEPDLVVCGNFHWAEWPLAIMPSLVQRNIPVISYVHDCHWLTGRCAYTNGCDRYLVGCDASCPTPTEYPPLPPEEIGDAWRERREVFCDQRVPLFANSNWMAEMARSAFHGRANVRLVPLGLDVGLFSPIDRALARRLLGLPPSTTLILAGAVNLKEGRKSGPLFDALLSKINALPDVKMVTFGARSNEFPGVVSLGPVQDERIMPIVFSAADIMLHTAQEESFGQTLMEASACAVPLVAFSAGGIVDIARNEVNALTAGVYSAEASFKAIQTLLNDVERRKELGQGGRQLVERCFSLQTQYQSWRENLLGLAHAIAQ